MDRKDVLINDLITCLQECLGSGELDGDYLVDVIGFTESEVKQYFDADYKLGGLHELQENA